MMKRDAEALRRRPQRLVIGDDDRDVHGQVAGFVAGEQVVEAVVFLRDEQGDALALAGEAEAHLHLMAARHGLQAGLDLLFFEREVFQAPLQAHEEGVLLRVDVLLEVDDVALMREDEAGDVMHEPGAVRAVDEQRGDVGHVGVLSYGFAIKHDGFRMKQLETLNLKRGAFACGKPRANAAALDQGRNLFGVAAGGDDALDAAMHGVLHGAQFGNHAAGAERGFFLLGMMDHFVDVGDDGNGAFLGLFHVTQQAGGAGEEDEHVRAPKTGDAGGELVVVAVTQFLDGHGVVLVDDGHDLGELDEAVQHRFHARRTFGILEVFMRDEKLGHMQAVVPQQGFIGVHQVRLAHGGEGLKRGDVGGALFELQRLQTRRPRHRC
jgi:hypothetical protein